MLNFNDVYLLFQVEIFVRADEEEVRVGFCPPGADFGPVFPNRISMRVDVSEY